MKWSSDDLASAKYRLESETKELCDIVGRGPLCPEHSEGGFEPDWFLRRRFKAVAGLDFHERVAMCCVWTKYAHTPSPINLFRE